MGKLLIDLGKLVLIVLAIVLASLPSVWFLRSLGKTKKKWRELRRAEENAATANK